ncbi:MAG: Gfo/Idh/MocA family oxidoreductase [Candidatus Omnitrophica bacterium]|nr:Gfo/Idh/MocA family oxidoreductase [Candidatus Omnitrophota bacterium]
MTNIGVVGYGYWGPNVVRNLAENKSCKITSICELNQEKWESIRKRYPWVNITNDYQDLINSPQIEAIVITTPVSTHYSLAKQALENKKHIFVEKPLTDSVESAQELVELAKCNACILFVDHTFEYSPAVIKIKEIIDSGQIGKIHCISSFRINLGPHRKDVSVISDLAPHDLSMFFYWLNEEPTQISAVGKGFFHEQIFDIAFITMKFPCGAIANINISWFSPIKSRRMTIIGSEKMIVYDDMASIEKVKVYDSGVATFREPESFGQFQLSYRAGDIFSPRLQRYEPLAQAVNHFLECVRFGKSPRTDGADALRVVRAVELAEESLRRNCSV